MISVLGNIWNQKNFNDIIVYELKKELDITEFLAQLISYRVLDLEEAKHFLDPKLKYLLPDPMHLIDMKKAINRVIDAIIKKQKICIFADYDVDGATSSALIKSFFRDIGIIIDIYVPDRINEGYGPSIQAMQTLKDKGVDLLITVDCGTVAFDPINHANTIGLDVIVIDHHISIDTMPAALAIINPNRLDETSGYKNLAAVGVSFLFIVGLCNIVSENGSFNQIPKPNLMQYLDLVALGTVCDVMSITKLNRAFVKQGLKVMMQRKNIGLKTLIDKSNITERLNCYHLGFIIGPRINAGGRVGESDVGAKLLSTTSINEANIYSQKLEIFNQERKNIEAIILEEAMQIAENQINDNILFIVGVGWHIGVIGIIASRIKDKFNKPVAVIALNNGIGKASCRSVQGFDFGNKIIEAKNHNLITQGGGHYMAAGFTVLEDKIYELKDYLNSTYHHTENKQIMYYDKELSLKSINFDLLNQINQLEPFGNDNPEPIFKISNITIINPNIIGDKHISCILTEHDINYNPIKKNNNHYINAIAFNSINTQIADILLNNIGKNISILGILRLNNWQNNYKIQLQIQDIYI